MKALATLLAMGGLVFAAPAALAQQQGAQQQGAQQPGQQGGSQTGQQQPRLGSQATQQLAGQPEIEQALKEFPEGARNAITKAAQAQGGQLIGVERETRNGDKHYEAVIARAGRLYEMRVDSDGKLLKWEPQTH